MNVVIEIQDVMGRNTKGIPIYLTGVVRELLKRQSYNYELTFFDYNKERNNAERARDIFGNATLKECNTLDYREISSFDTPWIRSYNEWTNSYGDVYWMPSVVSSVPSNLMGEMVITIHDLTALKYGTELLRSEQSKKRFLRSLEKAVKTHALIVCVSESAKNEVLEFSSIPETDIYVNYEFCDNSILFHDKGDKRLIEKYGIDREYIFDIGSVNQLKKNYPRLIRAFNIVAAKNKDLMLVIAGAEVAHPLLETEIEYSPYRDRIRLIGEIEDDEKRVFYSNALCLVFPSLAEGFGLPVLEAMNCGCPVITSNTTSLPEVAGDAAILVNPRDELQLAYEMERIVYSDSLRAELTSKGYKQASKFTIEKHCNELEQLFKFAVERGKIS